VLPEKPDKPTTPPIKGRPDWFEQIGRKRTGRQKHHCNVVAPGFIQTDMTDVLPDAVKEGAKAFIPLNVSACRRRSLA